MNISTISHYVPKIRIASPEQVVKNLAKIAVPVIALVATAMIHQAQSIGYVECINNCNEPHSFAKLVCYALCRRE